jgi:resolvase-like protein
MAGGRFMALYRVSTGRQQRSGLGLEAQRDVVLGYLRDIGGDFVAEFVEAVSGRKGDDERPQLTAAIAACRVHGTRLVVSRLDSRDIPTRGSSTWKPAQVARVLARMEGRRFDGQSDLASWFELSGDTVNRWPSSEAAPYPGLRRVIFGKLTRRVQLGSCMVAARMCVGASCGEAQDRASASA